VGFYVGPHRAKQHDIRQLERAASAIAGRDVRVSCPGILATLTEVSVHDGSVAFSPDGRPGDETKLSSGTCAHLRAVLAREVAGLECLALETTCSEKAERVAVAVNVLSHEGWHLAGERSEAATQCYALQTNEETALRLGATAAEARAIAAYVRRKIQPALPAEYRTGDCYDGGPLDLRPDIAAWP
jgi:hypothetical protein